MQRFTRKTDQKARLTLPIDFASCHVTIERYGDELRICKVSKRRFTFRQLMAKVTKENIHREINTGPPIGKEL